MIFTESFTKRSYTMYHTSMDAEKSSLFQSQWGRQMAQLDSGTLTTAFDIGINCKDPYQIINFHRQSENIIFFKQENTENTHHFSIQKSCFQLTYNKIPNISPGPIEVRKPFLEG